MADVVNKQWNVQDTAFYKTDTKTATKQVKSGDNSILGKDAFMKLLVTQLRYQDPLNPMQDKDFIAQTAQFSSLEHMMNLSKSFSGAQAVSYLGKNVQANDNKTGEIVAGKVTEVKTVDGEYVVTVEVSKDIKKDFSLTDIQKIFA